MNKHKMINYDQEKKRKRANEPFKDEEAHCWPHNFSAVLKCIDGDFN